MTLESTFRTLLSNEREGRFLSATFIKKNGTRRTMLIQPASAKYHVRGDAASESAQRATRTRAERHPHLVSVWDVHARAFRSVNLDTLERVRAYGHEWTCEGD